MATSLLQGKPFFCREWAFLKLAHCLEQRGGSGAGGGATSSAGAVILGGPGSGKTALCCELVWPTNLPLVQSQSASHAPGDPPPSSPSSSSPPQPPQPHSSGAARQRSSLRRRLLAYHFCQAHDAESLAPAPFVRRLAEQLSESPLLPGFGEKLMRDPEAAAALRPGACERDPDQALQRAVLFPLLELDPPPHRPCLMLVDAVDESHAAAERAVGSSISQSSSSGSRSIAELLSAHHHLLPRWLLLVVTARRQSRTVVSRLFAGFRRLALDDLRRAAVVRDVQGYILARLDREEALRAHVTRDTAEMLNQLHIKSAGCILYLERVLDGVADGFVGLREVREIPGTLNGLYLWLCQRLFNRKQFARVQPLLCVILAAREPLTTETLFRAVWTSNSSLTREDLARRLALLRRVLAPCSLTGDASVLNASGTKKSGRTQFTPGQIILLFHPSFAEWLLDVKHCTRKYLCSAADGNAMLAAALWLRGPKLTPAETRALTLHLSASPIKPPLQQWHLAAWLAESGAPLEECLEKAPPSPHRDPRALRLLIDAGAKRKVATSEGEDAMQRSTVQASEPGSPCGEGEEAVPEVTESAEPEEDPLADLLAAEEAALAAEAAAAEGGSLVGATLGNGRTALHSLAAEGDERRVRLLLSRQGAGAAAALTIADRHGQTPLGLAARHGHAGVVRALLEAAGEMAATAVDSADADGWTPLRSAAWGGHAAVVEALLEAGAKVDGADAEGRTALRAAAWGGHEEVVLGLLRAGADPGGADREGRTPLIAAAYMGHAEIVSHLLDFGAPVDHEDADGRTALSVAALCVPANEGYAKLEQMHANGVMGPDISTHIHERCEPVDLKVVSILLERGAAVDHEDHEGMTALLVAAFEGHRDVCELLLEYEADVDHSDGAGRTPLWAAASMGHTAVVELLLFWGCGVDGIDAEGRTVLGVAANQGCADVVRRLLDRGLDETHRDNAGWTPLHYAAFEGHRDAAEALLDAGARLDDTDNEGKAPLALAAQKIFLICLLKAFPTGGSSSTTSMTSGSTAETKPSSAVLCQPQVPPFSQAAQVGSALLPSSGPTPHQHQFYHQHQLPPLPPPHHGGSSHIHSSPPPHPQPLDSPESSVDKRRSVASLGNRSSGGLSSSNCTGSTKSSQRSSSEPHGVAQSLPPPLLPPSSHPANCTSHQCQPQQLPMQHHHNPHHHLYHQLSFTQQLQQCTRAAKSRPQGGKTGVPPPPGALSPLSEPQSPIYASPPPSPLSDAPSGRRSPAPANESPATANGAVPHVGLHPIPGVTDNVTKAPPPLSFNRDAHMKIILGGGRPDQTTASSTPAASKLKRNGIVTNPNVKVSGGGVGGLVGFRLGLKNGLEARRRQAGARANGFPWKKETPL
ncbi:hypothetical protein J437_LFUL009911 [Ladona fulva]|uniref:Ankyrin repeat domain-containing protein 50 n=1 Tax=Ladona fulva TaxID=123851 RepID=A0A8K0K2D5_LADFU|nr:hypothetical protein J437_LFUL009911 [Ladona fulva]